MPAVIKSSGKGPEYFITSFDPTSHKPYNIGLNRSDAYEFTASDLDGQYRRSFSDIASDASTYFSDMTFVKDILPRVYPKFISDVLIGVWFVPKKGNFYAPERLYVAGYESGKVILRRDEPTDFVRLDIVGVERELKRRFGKTLRSIEKITPYWRKS